jgi:hypothetical protein
MQDSLIAGYRAIDAAAGHETRVAVQCKALLYGYAVRYHSENADYEVVEIEKVYTAPLRNLEPKGRVSRKWTLAGKIDKLIKIDGEHYLVDHKTTSLDISDPVSNYWRVMRIDSQPRHYETMLYSNGIPLRGIIWDVVKKPTIRPIKITGPIGNSINATGKYLDDDVSPQTMNILHTLERENDELHSIRLNAHIAANTEKYYQRRPIALTEDELYDYNKSLWQVAEDMTKTIKRSKSTGITPYNPSGCMMYNTPCTFLGICSRHDSITSDNWTKSTDVHPELEGEAEASGKRELLTNSRVKCFQLCPTKHHYKYVMGLERVQEERNAAFFFGNVWHTGMDAWWAAVSGYERNNYDSNKSKDHEEVAEKRPHGG